MITALDFTSKTVLLVADGVVRRNLMRRLESCELETPVAWVDITLLMPDGTSNKLFHNIVGKVPKDEKPVEPTQYGTIAHKTAQAIHRLLKMHLIEGRFCGLPDHGTLDYNGTFCLPHGIGTLLVSCTGFPDRRSNHMFSQVIGLELDHELLRLSGQLKLGKSTT